MAWVRIDDHFYDSEKWDAAPADSVGLWVAAIAWCNRNDDREDARQGIIPAFKLKSLLTVPNFKRTITDLLARRAMYEVDGGYQIHDYVDYQQTEKVRAIRDKRRESGRKGAAARWGSDGKEDGKPMADAMASDNGKLCPDPDPDPEVLQVTNSPPPHTDAPGGKVPVDKRRMAVVEAYAKHAADNAKSVGNRPAYEAKAAATCKAHPDLDRYVRSYPDAPVSAIAAWLHGDKHSMRYYEAVDPSAPDADVVNLNDRRPA